MEATVGSVGIPLDGVNNVRGSCSLTSKQEASEATNQDKLGYLWRSSSYLVSQDLTDLRIKTLHIKRISLSNQESEILRIFGSHCSFARSPFRIRFVGVVVHTFRVRRRIAGRSHLQYHFSCRHEKLTGLRLIKTGRPLSVNS